MGPSGIRDDAPPWSFFLPVTLAVVVGVVTAALLLRGIDAVFGDRGNAAQAEEARAHAPERTGESGRATGPGLPPDAEASAHPSVDRDAVHQEPRQPAPARESTADSAGTVPAPGEALGLPMLPGAVVAKRDGAPEACINGSIALRAENGWEQRLENNAPVPCVEASTTAR